MSHNTDWRNSWTKKEIKILKRSYKLSWKKLLRLLSYRSKGSIQREMNLLRLYRGQPYKKGIKNPMYGVHRYGKDAPRYNIKLSKIIRKKISKFVLRAYIKHHIDLNHHNNKKDNINYLSRSNHSKFHSTLNHYAVLKLSKSDIRKFTKRYLKENKIKLYSEKEYIKSKQ